METTRHIMFLVIFSGYAYGWLDGVGLGCKWSTLSKGKAVEFDHKCINGTIEWSYPRFPQVLTVRNFSEIA